MFPSLRQWIRERWTNRYAHRNTHLLGHAIATLEANLEKFQRRRTDGAQDAILADLERRLQGEATWKNVFQMELVSIPLLSAEEIEIDLLRQLQAVEKLVPEAVSSTYRDLYQQAESREAKEALLERLIEVIYRHDTVQYDINLYSTVTRVRTGGMFILAFIFFFLPNLVPDTFRALIHGFMPGADTRPGNVLTVISAGWLGASFSMLISLNRRLESSSPSDLRMISRFSSMIMRVILGMGASVILYYFLQAGLLDSPLLPEFDFTNDGVVAGRDNWALLIIASFLAGFSEQLVPAILLRTGSQIGGDEPKADS